MTAPRQPTVRHPDPAEEYYFQEGCHILECWNSAADGDASIARARVAPARTTRRHRLAGITERYVILAGQGRVTLDRRRGEDVGPGAVVVIPPGCDQQIENTGTRDLVFLAICTPRFSTAAYQDTDEQP